MRTHRFACWKNFILHKKDRTEVKRNIRVRIPMYYTAEAMQSRMRMVALQMKEKEKAGFLWFRNETEADIDRYARYIERSLQMHINEEEAWVKRVLTF